MENNVKQLTEKLNLIQVELKAPKGQFNNFGKYKYRSAEDILEALKPYLKKHKLTLTITEQIEEKASILFVVSTVILSDGDGGMSVQAQAGINPERKGMDISQSFGASSSYAKKYALGNMFLLDDTKDADATHNHSTKPSAKAKPKMTQDVLDLMLKAIEEGKGDKVKERMPDYTMTKQQKETLTKLLK
tara:strand:- start:1895 stop:2461 length:567 start_codon:yes stop_codon:yes gene_type:complete